MITVSRLLQIATLILRRSKDVSSYHLLSSPRRASQKRLRRSHCRVRIKTMMPKLMLMGVSKMPVIIWDRTRMTTRKCFKAQSLLSLPAVETTIAIIRLSKKSWLRKSKIWCRQRMKLASI